MILVIDNYDSFVYNLVQYVGKFDDVVVKRNDEIVLDEVYEMDPDGIIISPGPGTPDGAGISMDIFTNTTYPTLGVCLGHQALCKAYGAPVSHAPEVIHGKPSMVYHDESSLYDGVENPFRVGRYHSLAIRRRDLPVTLVETATISDDSGIVMGVKHIEKPHYGVQFHPESILTDAGTRLIENFCTSLVEEPILKTRGARNPNEPI
jgi:anthranilate synthase component 2